MKTEIKCGKLFNPNTKQVETNRLIIVDGDKVSEVLDLQGVDLTNFNVIDLTDKFVMPGLIDAHVHSGMNGEGDSPATRVRQLIGESALHSDRTRAV